VADETVRLGLTREEAETLMAVFGFLRVAASTESGKDEPPGTIEVKLRAALVPPKGGG
jgi:hypothetical protein